MRSYTIVTDSGCDLNRELLSSWGVRSADLTFRFDDSNREYVNGDMDISEFYRKMRAGGRPQTAAVNVEAFRVAFEQELKNGNDILYIGLSSGLSNTYNAGQIAAKELSEEWPDRSIITLDTLCASAGLGMLVYMAKQEKDAGASVTEAAQYIMEKCPNVCHWYTVDDLIYLKRGGRISATTAFAATVLGIRPVMHMNDEGKLENVLKVRGRKRAIRELADRYMSFARDTENGIYFISHGDCYEDAKQLENLIFEKTGHKATIITDVSPVIGSHSGPGTLALFFIGEER